MMEIVLWALTFVGFVFVVVLVVALSRSKTFEKSLEDKDEFWF